ncbi:peptide chain release factor N(5)-glutamine methyltransferase [Patescibacteria group bacterium]|nr:peptide chain release factor N(5)-glutamine methyltransferase [Patescibacteria group bacterium]
MTIKKVLQKALKSLQAISDSSALDAEVLLCFVLGVTKEKLYEQLDQELPAEQQKKYWQLVTRRQKHEPIAYITKHKEFYGLDFHVDERVLIPRPDTEVSVETVIEKYGDTTQQKIIADIGTGSGCIAVALAKNLPVAKIYAVDISAEALAVAEINVAKYKMPKQVTLLQGNLLEPLPEKVDIIVANLPYVTPERLKNTARGVSKDIRLFEPKIALLAREGGVEIYKKLLSQTQPHLKPGALIFLEIDPTFTKKLVQLAQKYFPPSYPQIKKDFAGKERVLVIEAD